MSSGSNFSKKNKKNNVFVCFRAKGPRGFANFQGSKYKELFSTLLQGYRDKNVSLTAVKVTLPKIMHQWKQCFKCIFKLEFVKITYIYLCM